jgi:hypothetical protein
MKTKHFYIFTVLFTLLSGCAVDDAVNPSIDDQSESIFNMSMNYNGVQIDKDLAWYQLIGTYKITDDTSRFVYFVCWGKVRDNFSSGYENPYSDYYSDLNEGSVSFITTDSNFLTENINVNLNTRDNSEDITLDISLGLFQNRFTIDKEKNNLFKFSELKDTTITQIWKNYTSNVKIVTMEIDELFLVNLNDTTEKTKVDNFKVRMPLPIRN